MKKKSTLRRLLGYCKPYLGFLILALVFAVGQIVATLFAPVIIGNAVDYMIGAGAVDFEKILIHIIELAAAIAAAALCQWLVGLCTNKTAYGIIRDLRVLTFDKLNTVPLKFIDGRSHGDIMARVSGDIDLVSDGVIQGFTQLFTGIVTIIGTLVFMLTINWLVTVVVVVVTPVSIFVAYFIAKGCHNKFRDQAIKRGELSGLVEEMLEGQKTVKSYNYEGRAAKRYEAINQDLKKVGVKAMFYSALINPSTRFVNSIVYAAVTVIGAFLCVRGGLTVGGLSCFLSYANQYTKPFNEVTGVIAELQSALAAAGRVFDILDEADEVETGSLMPQNVAGNIDVEHVCFSYNENPLIEDFNLQVKSGMRVAIVGPTGCGKTTLINLLMRFYDVKSGSIKVDGVDIRDYTRKDLRGMYGMVLQESWLFEGTVRENIAYGKPDATLDEVIAAAKSARIHGFIKRLKNGYDTQLEPDSLSQGQKQLLCIARIMLVKPPMLILDEATSNIDTRTEIRIQEAFATLMQGRTSFIVAHRLSTIVGADVILVMRDGNVIEKGTHTELLQKGGFYKKLYYASFDTGEKA
ncbi:MAG: ABC transporter ATP-binding protein [Clostridia bacterium]|nr:ABC transporter ATP-binding protein [Clostridia bacterium]